MKLIEIKMTPGQAEKLNDAIDGNVPFGLISQPTMIPKVFKVLILNERQFIRLYKYMNRFIRDERPTNAK